MKMIVSAGGTGGHIYPALAIINKFKEKEPDLEVLYIGTHNRMEKDIILHEVEMDKIKAGDYIEINGVGAYTIALTPTFINYLAPILSIEN